MIEVKFKRVGQHDLPLPSKGSKGAAAWDVRSREFVVLSPGETKVIDTGFAVEVPEGYELCVYSRSGMSTNGVFVINSPGTIDSDYRDSVGVILTNTGHAPSSIEVGDRIAQLKLRKVLNWKPIEVDSLSETERGKGGFGSTGV